MIKNEKQYKITKSHLKKFEEALQDLNHNDNQSDPLLLQIQKDALESQIDQFQRELREYDDLKEGNLNIIDIKSIHDLHKVIIKARIASGYTQRNFAEMLGLKEQQIQRYESTDYASISFERLKEIVDVLNLKIWFEKVLMFRPSFHVPDDVEDDLDKIQSKVASRGELFIIE